VIAGVDPQLAGKVTGRRPLISITLKL
jgi:hypothetical protein